MTGLPMPEPVLRLRTPGSSATVSPSVAERLAWRSDPPSTLTGCGEVSDVVATGAAVTWRSGSSTSEALSSTSSVMSSSPSVTRRTWGANPIAEKLTLNVPEGRSAIV